MFNNMSLPARMFTAFLFMGLIVLIVALVGWSATYRLNTHLNTLSTTSLPSVLGMWKIKEGQTQIESSARALLNPKLLGAERRAELASIRQALEHIDDGFSQYDPAPRTEEEEKLYKKLQTNGNRWRQDLEDFLQLNQEFESLGILNPLEVQLALVRQGRERSPEMAEAKTATNLFNKLYERSQANRIFFEGQNQSILKILEINEEVATAAYKAAQEDVSKSLFWAVTGLLLGPLTAVIFGLYFSNTIAKPLGAKIIGVVTVAEQISAGDLTTSVPVPEDRDEIGKLLVAFRTMTKSLSSLISQVQQSGIQVTSSATQIAASGKQLEATVQEQLASTNEVVATAKEIAATSGELVRTMDEVTEMAHSTATAAGAGQKDLSRMEATMSQLADATSAISAKLGAISEKANNINSIVTTIAKVADQTNLLSLNAAIEAEKAGEYGLGFAVVAREIRRLADQTAVATLDIEQMVKEMQSAVSTGVMEMDKFTREVSRGVDDIRNISAQIAQIIERVQALTPRFEAVNQGVEAQSTGATQISEAMVQLSEASSQTAQSLREINSAIGQLNETAQGLRREISRFQVGD
ncbi:methyl-accepting chemotaxis protein [Kamptonema formosum]|uniref:methyl-accepting chemotaxis protein n=1 Tax=Kamptonema formosum TaxID=331992 RepID=UPI0003768A60|nr:methyl-accepting chemotaxis protein [Oscillatoria sp. PCC 10802]